VAETVPGFNVQSMFGLVVASRTSRDVVAKIYADVITALKKPDTQKKMTELGLEPVSITPDQFDVQIKTDIDRWTQLVRSANIKLE